MPAAPFDPPQEAGLLAVRDVEPEQALALIDEHLLHADAHAPAVGNVLQAKTGADHRARAALGRAVGADAAPAEAGGDEGREHHVARLRDEGHGHAGAEAERSRADTRILRIGPAEIAAGANRDLAGILAIADAHGAKF